MIRVTDEDRRRVAAELSEWEFYYPQNLDRDLCDVFGVPEDANKFFALEDVDNPEDTFIPNILARYIEPQPITGDTSDGYHTFNELYDHRAKLFSVIVRCFKDRAWKSKLHHDGTMYEGMFIVGIETSQGQATYHYDIDPYWDMFDCKELARAPEWDGHTPEQAISRITSLRPSCDREALLELADDLDYAGAAVENVAYIDQTFHESARRIREALGE